MKKWICEKQVPTPQTKDGCAPALTATYDYASIANMFDTSHYPRMGVIEIGRYEDEDRPSDSSGPSVAVKSERHGV